MTQHRGRVFTITADVEDCGDIADVKASVGGPPYRVRLVGGMYIDMDVDEVAVAEGGTRGVDFFVSGYPAAKHAGSPLVGGHGRKVAMRVDAGTRKGKFGHLS